MATLKEIRQSLDKDELNYPKLAQTYGESALPHLKALVTEDEPRIAPKAAYLAGLIAGEASHEVVGIAARSRHDVTRVAAAAATAMLPGEQAVDIASQLLDDADVGVRVMAAKTAAKIGDSALIARLRVMADEDTEDHVRELAAQVADTLDRNAPR
jgi:HEAT repeat protein